MSAPSRPDPPGVLLVSHLPSERDRLEPLLRKAGYAVRTAADGAIALQVMEIEPADLLLLEINLPDMPGLQLHQILREQFGPRPAIFLGREPGGLTLRLIDALPWVRYLPAPAPPDILLATLQAMLGEAISRQLPPDAD